MPAWTVELKESVIDALRALGIKQGRAVLKEASARLAENPLAQTRHLKTLRPNLVAERELRLFGRYRVLFTVAEAEATVTIVLVGEKRGNSLYVQGKRITAYESRSTERGYGQTEPLRSAMPRRAGRRDRQRQTVVSTGPV